jgi:hypothetical protein
MESSHTDDREEDARITLRFVRTGGEWSWLKIMLNRGLWYLRVLIIINVIFFVTFN